MFTDTLDVARLVVIAIILTGCGLWFRRSYILMKEHSKKGGDKTWT